MAFEIKVNKPVTSLRSLSVYLRGEKKIGKTTLFKNVSDVLYNGDYSKTLLVGVGNEVGYKAIGGLQVGQAESWKDFEELKKLLINEKGKSHNIEMVCFDTADEWIPIAETEVCRLSQIKTQKKCDSINSAFGGFGKGQDKVLELIKGYISDLRKAGIGVWVIAHTKDKTIKEKGMTEEEGYQILTSSLSNKYEGLFGDMFDMVLTGYRDRDVTNGKVTKTTRKLAFRGTYAVDAGCRVASEYLPDEMEFADTEKETAERFVSLVRSALQRTSGLEEKEYKTAEEAENKKLNEIKVTNEELELNREMESSFDREKALDELKIGFMKDAKIKNVMMNYLKETEVKKVQELTDGQIKTLLKKING